MKSLVILSLALLTASCASHRAADDETLASDSDQPALVAQGTQWQAPVSTGSEWMVHRQAYTTCVIAKADTLVRNVGSSQDIAEAALQACESTRENVRIAFRHYLETQMVSAHGKRGAALAADQMASDAEGKLRSYLVQYVNHARSIARLN
jgi:hypothetical protein